MKKATLLFVCMGTMFCSFAQETPSETPEPVLTKEEYKKKSKGERTAAIVMISAGGVMTIAGFAVVLNNLDFNGLFDSNYQPKNQNETLEYVLVIGGLAAMLGSIPLFVSAHKNKKRAMSVSFINEPVLQLQKSMVFYRAVPSLNLKIRL